MSILTWLWPALALAANPLTLEQYLSEVKSNYPSLASARARAGAMEERVSPAGAWDDPFFAMGIDQIPTKGMDTSSVWRYQLSQTIPFPGKRGASGESAEARAVAARADTEALDRELTLIAMQLFYRAFYIDSAIEANGRTRKFLQGALDSSRARYRTGGSSHHEWLLAKAELAVLDVEKLRLQREKKSLLARMNEMRNRSPDTPFGNLKVQLSGIARKVSPKLENQPELKSFDAALSGANAEARAAKLAYAPDFMVQGMLMKPRGMPAEGSMTSAMPPSWGFMVGINVPLFFPWKQADLVSAANLEREAAVQERRSIENRLNSEIVDAQEQLSTAQNIVELYKDSVIPTTRIAAGNARSSYASKRLPLSQLLDVLRAESSQELELLAAKVDVELAMARLENLLSSPPMARFAPSRPTLFGGMAGGMTEMPEASSMGRGTVVPKKNVPGGGGRGSGSSGGMEGM